MWRAIYTLPGPFVESVRSPNVKFAAVASIWGPNLALQSLLLHASMPPSDRPADVGVEEVEGSSPSRFTKPFWPVSPESIVRGTAVRPACGGEYCREDRLTGWRSSALAAQGNTVGMQPSRKREGKTGRGREGRHSWALAQARGENREGPRGRAQLGPRASARGKPLGRTRARLGCSRHPRAAGNPQWEGAAGQGWDRSLPRLLTGRDSCGC
ncbi:MAG: hypothetical protein KatS3mg005_0373 [Bryobacteraceae bacterium]|nr:MAG: hypothetical protein KatS3mg005_0373 [Bryobacteraceae bacterium]